MITRKDFLNVNDDRPLLTACHFFTIFWLYILFTTNYHVLTRMCLGDIINLQKGNKPKGG